MATLKPPMVFSRMPRSPPRPSSSGRVDRPGEGTPTLPGLIAGSKVAIPCSGSQAQLPGAVQSVQPTAVRRPAVHHAIRSAPRFTPPAVHRTSSRRPGRSSQRDATADVGTSPVIPSRAGEGRPLTRSGHVSRRLNRAWTWLHPGFELERLQQPQTESFAGNYLR